MSPIEIRSGLRKLEFEPPAAVESAGAEKHVLVEFVRPDPLDPEVSVRIVLGARNGLLREIIGQPRLVDTLRAARGAAEYRYQLHGPIAVSSV